MSSLSQSNNCNSKPLHMRVHLNLWRQLPDVYFSWSTDLLLKPWGLGGDATFTFPCAELSWACREHLTLNFSPQIEQTKGFSPVCILIWIFKLSSLENAFPQTVHGYILGIVSWVWRCILRDSFEIQTRPQMWHGLFSLPEHLLSCLFRLLCNGCNIFPQYWQAFLGLVCPSMCIAKVSLLLKSLPQMVHLKVFPEWTAARWTWKYYFQIEM